MFRRLIIENDPSFILKIQKLFPKNTEWVAAYKIERIIELLYHENYDEILIRKKNESLLMELLLHFIKNTHRNSQQQFKKITVLPEIGWRKKLRNL